jgi:hypothetical protein
MAIIDPTLFSEDDPRFTIDRSTISGAGNGVFTRATFAEGDRFEVIGALIRADSPSDVCTAYADLHKFRVGEFLLIPVGYGGLVNHSRTPNLEKIIEGRRVYFRALRTIPPGEELFFTYPPAAIERFGLEKNRSTDKHK